MRYLIPTLEIKSSPRVRFWRFEGRCLSTSSFFRPLIVLHRNNGVLHAVAMGPSYSGRTRRILTLTPTGEVIGFNFADIMLCVPGFVDERLIDSCGSMKL